MASLDTSDQPQERAERDPARQQQPDLLVSPSDEFDPYYFGLSNSPVPSLSTDALTRASHSKEDAITPGGSFEDIPPKDDRPDDQPDAPDSPWTIEAVDDEMAEREEEILYPRKPNNDPRPELPLPVERSDEPSPPSEPSPKVAHVPPPLDLSLSDVPEALNAFSQPRRVTKRPSNDFELNQPGPLIPSPTKFSGRHSRQTSTSSSSSSHADNFRRVHTDFSRLPPSPSPSSILSFLKHSGPDVSQAPPLPSRELSQPHPSSNVAHSLLQGSQEGWSGMDEATAEALRKLDGLSGKSAHARASVASSTRSTGSRPGTPAKSGSTQWEGIGSVDLGRKGSRSSRDSTMSQKGTASARSSFTPERGSTSTSSTTYASTHTTSSRDSALSVMTPSTSVSAASSRHSKARRDSVGSDISSIHSSANGDALEEEVVPPVPPLPKDLSTYRSPSTGLTFPVLTDPDEDSNQELLVLLEAPSPPAPNAPPPAASSDTPHRSQHHSGYESQTSLAPESTPAVRKTPSQKWSFSNALRLSGSPASSPKSPRSVTFAGQQLRKSASKDQTLSPASPNRPWEQPAAMSSATSLGSSSFSGSITSPGRRPPSSPKSSKTPDREPVASRAGTDSSASPTNTTSALSPHSLEHYSTRLRQFVAIRQNA
ncbi:hypothetical protein B0H19DRAFT_61064 [Mycena capillaripes]|nr:hypothetical protein B0H19DRAFT_61064 [Mycena capillaripes]